MSKSFLSMNYQIYQTQNMNELIETITKSVEFGIASNKVQILKTIDDLLFQKTEDLYELSDAQIYHLTHGINLKDTNCQQKTKMKNIC